MTTLRFECGRAQPSWVFRVFQAVLWQRYPNSMPNTCGLLAESNTGLRGRAQITTPAVPLYVGVKLYVAAPRHRRCAMRFVSRVEQCVIGWHSRAETCFDVHLNYWSCAQGFRK